MKTPKELIHNEDVQKAYALETEVAVYALESLDGAVVKIGIVTDWDESTFYIDNIPFSRSEYVFLNFE